MSRVKLHELLSEVDDCEKLICCQLDCFVSGQGKEKMGCESGASKAR